MVVLPLVPLQFPIFTELNKQTMHVPSKTELFAMVKSPPMIPVWKLRLNLFVFSNAILVPPLTQAPIQMTHASPFHQLQRLSNVQTWPILPAMLLKPLLKSMAKFTISWTEDAQKIQLESQMVSILSAKLKMVKLLVSTEHTQVCLYLICCRVKIYFLNFHFSMWLCIMQQKQRTTHSSCSSWVHSTSRGWCRWRSWWRRKWNWRRGWRRSRRSWRIFSFDSRCCNNPLFLHFALNIWIFSYPTSSDSMTEDAFLLFWLWCSHLFDDVIESLLTMFRNHLIQDLRAWKSFERANDFWLSFIKPLMSCSLRIV